MPTWDTTFYAAAGRLDPTKNGKGGEPVKILLVHCRYRLAGGEDAVFEAERAMLQAHGHTVVTYERSNEEATGPAAPKLRKALLPLTALFSLRTYRDIRRLLHGGGFDAVHVHNTLLVVSPAVFRAAKAEGVPVVQTLHNFRLFCPNGVLLRGGQVCEDCPRHGLGCAVKHRCYRGSLAQSLVCAAVYALHRRWGTFRGVQFVALTEFDRQKLLEFNAQRPTFDPDRLTVKPNAVPLTDPPAPLPWAQRKRQIVFAGRLEELKGIRTALQAWALLRDEDPPTLIVCGTGPLEEECRAAAQGLAVRFVGYLPKEQLYALLRESQAALCPSLCYESFALVPAEAHALGTPVLASDLGNVGAAVNPGVDGLRFVPGDAAALADAVRRLPTAAPAMDLPAMQAAALAAYGPEPNYQQLMALYERCRSSSYPRAKENRA